jgi:hypothetical protein
MGFDLERTAIFEFSLPFEMDQCQWFALLAQIVLSEPDGPPAFSSLEDVPLTAETYTRVLEKVPSTVAEILRDVVEDFPEDPIPLENIDFEDVLTDECTRGGLDNVLMQCFTNSAGLFELVGEMANDVELAYTRVYQFDSSNSIHQMRLRIKGEVDIGEDYERGWEFAETCHTSLYMIPSDASAAVTRASGVGVQLRARDRMWSSEHTAEQAAKLERVLSRCRLSATDLAGWHVLLTEQGG